MKEDFLHYLWKFKKFDATILTTANGESLTIVNSGQYLKLAGPDFFNGQIIIGNQKWAGNIEIHIRSSDWYLHHHERDPAYENVILHVVWEHDVSVFRKNNTEIPVLILKNYTAQETIRNYLALSEPKSWIFCEPYITSIDRFVIVNWEARLLFERLEQKSAVITQLLRETNNDWEAAFFCLLAKNFGLNTNGESFLKMAQSIPFAVIRKEQREFKNLEGLFFGQLGLLRESKEDVFYNELQSNYRYLLHKHRLSPLENVGTTFFKHRPDNFPTIRLSQLAQVYSGIPNLFSKCMSLKSVKDYYVLFDVAPSNYWQTHYQFDAVSPKKSKKISKSFIDLLLINSVIPMRFAYAQHHQKEVADSLIALMSSLAPEQNAIIEKFALFGIKAENAFESQALLQLKNEYCNKRRCLECAIGASLMKNGGAENSL